MHPDNMMQRQNQNVPNPHRSSSYSSRPARRTWDQINMPYSIDASQQPARSEGESWVEISSQPSSSSLSSIGNPADAELIQTGLRVEPPLHRRSRRNTTGASTFQNIKPPHKASSSQDEYSSSSSETDGEDMLLSSTENLLSLGGRISPRQHMVGTNVLFHSPSHEDTDYSEDEQEDDGRTALGINPTNATQFMPNLTQLSPQTGSKMTPRPLAHDREGDSYFQSRFSSTTHRAASDAALRASLTTLLSCAQAARSLPKRSNTTMQPPARGSNEIQEFRMIPEAALKKPITTPQAPLSPGTQDKGKEKARPRPSKRPHSSTTASSDEREKRKRDSKTKEKISQRSKRATVDGAKVHQVVTQSVSPTLLTWIVSAGVVVFVSVVGFGAGYALGYERGVKEGGGLANCGNEVVRVRRFRWGGRGIIA